jgi:GlpG protein
MRLIGYLPNEVHARTFADFLYVQGIEAELEHQNQDGWAIWIRDEDKLDSAANLLKSFRENPGDSRYQSEAKGAGQLRSAEQKSEESYRKRQRSRRHLFRPLRGYGFGPLTFALIAACVGVFFLSRYGTDTNPIRALYISDPMSGTPGSWASLLPEVRHGEVWRLFTPVLIHFGVMHILFNMMWLKDLGSMIEGRQGTGHLLVLVLILAAFSDFAQYCVNGPRFGGMSGVVYGLLGYIWIRGKLDPGSGLHLERTTVVMMLVWFVLCFTPWLGMGPIANGAHAAGLVLGMVLGYFTSLRHR